MRNIGIFGSMYSGKSTLAEGLVENGYHRMSFAGPLKNVASLAYGKIDKSEMYSTTVPDESAVWVIDKVRLSPTYREKLVSGREILQGVGQYIKMMDRDFWLRAFMRDASNYLDVPLVVDDGRFHFERLALADAGWLIVGVNTSHAERMRRAVALTGREPTQAEQDHESEREVPSIVERADIILQGDGDTGDNVRKVLKAARG